MSVNGKKKQDCCGCNACAEICPRHCIEMRADRKGFLYPKVDTAACIECGLCERVCPFPAEESLLRRPAEAIAAWSKDPEVQQRSTSGGVAYLLGRHIIAQGGAVYGCASDGLNIHHVRVDRIEDLPRLQGSKYVQSDTRGIFSQVRADLDNGLTVLFTGTPCQTAGLRRFIRRNADRLYLVDLICHGVPSPKMLRDNLRPWLKDRHVDRITFRKEDTYAIRLYDGYVETCAGGLYGIRPINRYYQLFIDGHNLRPSCYNCAYTRPERATDITVGDFWGYPELEKLPERARRGLSVVMPSTDKGHALFEAVTPWLNTVIRPLDEALAGNHQLRHPVGKKTPAKLFDKLYPLLRFDTAARLAYLPGAIRRRRKL